MTNTLKRIQAVLCMIPSQNHTVYSLVYALWRDLVTDQFIHFVATTPGSPEHKGAACLGIGNIYRFCWNCHVLLPRASPFPVFLSFLLIFVPFLPTTVEYPRKWRHLGTKWPRRHGWLHLSTKVFRQIRSLLQKMFWPKEKLWERNVPMY